MALTTSSLPRLFIAAGGIYTAQGLVGGLTFLGLPAVLRAENVALDKIGLVSLAMLAWALKFLWAAPVERFRLQAKGRRRSRVIFLAGQAVVVFALIALGVVAGADFNMLLVLLIVMASASATIDIVCDAFVIEQFPLQRRGLGNVAQVGGGYLGMIFGSGLFVAACSTFGWTIAAFMLAVLATAMSVPMALISDRGTDLAPPKSTPKLMNGLRRREIQIGIALTIVFELGGRLAQSLAGPLLVDAGLSLTTLGILNGTGGVAAGLVGTAIGGFAAHRLGGRSAMLAVAIMQVVTLGALALTIAAKVDHPPFLVGLFVIESAVMAAGFVVSYARLMDLASPSQPGVDFTLFQSASAIAAALCGISAGLIAARAGYEMTFAVAATLAVLALPALFVLERCLGKGETE